MSFFSIVMFDISQWFVLDGPFSHILLSTLLRFFTWEATLNRAGFIPTPGHLQLSPDMQHPAFLLSDWGTNSYAKDFEEYEWEDFFK